MAAGGCVGRHKVGEQRGRLPADHAGGDYRGRVVPQEFRDFFTAAASTSGALIGLLFVAITVSQENARRVETRMEFHTRAAAALLAFLNALILSLAALVPGVSFGWWCVAAAVGIVAFSLATARSGLDEARRQRANWGPFTVVANLLIIAGFELAAGVLLLGNASSRGAISTICYVVIADLAAGISRSWQLVRMRDTGLVTSLRILARGDRMLTQDEDEGDASSADGASSADPSGDDGAPDVGRSG
jgi:hypothetical protein